MTADGEAGGATMLSPEDAFAVLGNEARLELLQTLGEADEPLAYSELFERMDYDDPGNFSYHLDKLVGHFIAKSDAGYTIRRPGERVLEAILSGVVTTDPVRDPTETDTPCPFCGAPMEVGYRQERVSMYCSECPGIQGREGETTHAPDDAGTLGFIPLPPAGVEGRTAGEMHQVAEIWTATSMQAIARDVCPRCSGVLDRVVNVCDSHDADAGVCNQCGLRLGATAAAACRNCVFEMEAPVAGHVAAHPEVMAFMTDHGIDPVAPEGKFPYAAVEETIASTEPFEARYAFTAGDETLTMTVTDELSVSEVTRHPASESGD